MAPPIRGSDARRGASSRSDFMSEASARLAASLDHHATLDTLAHLAVSRLADWCAIDELDADGRIRRIVVAHPDPERERLARELDERYPPDPDAPAGVPAVLRSGEPELVPRIPEALLRDVAHDEEHLRIILELGLRSYMVVPLRARGRTLGALSLVSAESGREFGPADLALAQELADRAALTIDNARLLREAREARRDTERLLESITDAFFALDDDWRFSYVNVEAQRVLGQRAEDLLGRIIWDAFPEAVDSPFQHAYERARAEQATVEFEAYFPPLETWFEVRAFPAEKGLSVFFRDVNDRVAAQEALRRQSELTRTISDNATSALFMMNDGGRCTYLNAAAERMIGWTLEEIGDRPLHDVIHHHHPDGRPYPIDECPIDRALPEDFSVRAHEDVFIRRSGEFFPVMCAAAPIFDDEQRPVGTVVEVRDVTEEHAAAEALRRSEERYRFQSETVPAQVWTALPDGRLDYVSGQTAAYFGVTPETVLSDGWRGFVHEEDLPGVAERWGHSVQTGEPYEVELRLRGTDGCYRWHLARATPKRGSDGRVEAWFGVNADIEERKRSQQDLTRLVAELDAERARLNELFRDAPAFIAVLRGPEHRFEMANPLYLVLVGGFEVLGRTVAEALPEVVEQGFIDLLDGVFATGEPFIGTELPVQLRRAGDGSLEERFVNFVYQPIRDADGRIDGIFVHGVDVTDQVLARRSVEAYAAERSAILGQIADGVMVAAADGRITFINETAERMLGTSVAAEDVAEYSSTYHVQRLDGEPYPPEELPMARALLGETVVGAEWRIAREDGTEIIGQGSAAPVRAADGTRLGAVLTMRDVTERIRLEAALTVERARLEEIFQEAPAAIMVSTGPDHVITSANPLYLQMTGRRDLLGQPIREAFPELADDGFFERLDEVFSTGVPFVGREMSARLDRRGTGEAEEAFFTFVYQPLTGPTGEVQGIMTFALEVTDQVLARREVEGKAEELARLARALDSSNRELDQFAYVASHDLKAPLRGIANLSQWIEEDLSAVAGVGEETVGHLDLLRGRVHRMEGLIDGILQYARVGRMKEGAERLETGPFVNEILSLIDVPPTVEVVVSDGMPTIFAERVPLQQVFMNLIGNAVKYARVENPRIEVTGEETPDGWVFSVSDNGPGIASEYHDRIFGIFQTLHARDEVEGTGIGLSIVRKIVESRGGRVWVESEEGTGATFRFRIPKPSTGAAA